MDTTLLRRIIPRRLRWLLRGVVSRRRIRAAYAYDRRRYVRYSSSVTPLRHRDNLRAVITERYHSIEKGLSLSTPRPCFGKKPLGDLVRYVEEYERRHGADEVTRHAVSVLASYLAFNEAAGHGEDVPHAVDLRRLVRRADSPPGQAGARSVTRAEVLAAVASGGPDFFDSRHSTRQFSSRRPTRREVETAVAAALKAPAVCNRQFAKVRVHLGSVEIQRLLAIQGGARGFVEEITGLAIITTNSRSYWHGGQRNQGWIDGGLFAMSFIHGLHAQGLGSIALNWAVEPDKDRELRVAASIPDEELIIMMVGFGHLRESYEVAVSPRPAVSSALLLVE